MAISESDLVIRFLHPACSPVPRSCGCPASQSPILHGARLPPIDLRVARVFRVCWKPSDHPSSRSGGLRGVSDKAQPVSRKGVRELLAGSEAPEDTDV